METFLRSLKEHHSHAIQQQGLEEEQQPLLSHNNFHTAQSHDLQDQTEVVVNIESDNGCGKESDNASQPNSGSASSKLPGSSNKNKFSVEEVFAEAVRKRSKDLPDHEISQSSSSSRVAEVLKRSSNYCSRKNTWRSLMDKTKSRLIDPQEEQYGPGRVSRKDYEHDEDGIEDIPDEYKRMKFNALTILQWASLVLIIAALVCSLSFPVIKRQTLCDLPLWKWEILLLALVCGRLVSGWGVRFAVFFIERSFLWRKRVLYFVYGLRKAVQNCLWLGLVLFVWHCIFDDEVEQETKSKVLPYVSKVLVCFLVGTLIWLLKTLLVKVLASAFHVNTFFERIQEALFSQYAIETLSGPRLYEGHHTKEEERPVAEVQGFQNSEATMPGDLRPTRQFSKCPTVGRKPRFSRTMSRKQDEIPIDHLHKLNQKNISAWNMKRMIKIVRHGSLSTLDEQILNSDMEDESSMQIESEYQAKEAAKKIFQKVAKPGSPYIYLDDLMCFMEKHEALKTMRLFGAVYENEGISKSSLKSWLVHAFRERRALSLSLNDTKTAVDELHNMLNILVAVIMVIIWLLILGIRITHFLVFISSQLLLVVFIFGNTCKTTFEAIIFLFIMHPFDVGDRCEVDGISMIVEEMNILTTVFLRHDMQKITYPNSVLATKPIGNFFRSPDMIESIEFCFHISTPMEKISAMKERILRYVENNKDQWHHSSPNPMMFVMDVEDMNRVKMCMWLKHRSNFQSARDRFARRAPLVEEMIKVFKDLGIEYRMLPLDVNHRAMPATTSNRLPSNWTACATDN